MARERVLGGPRRALVSGSVGVAAAVVMVAGVVLVSDRSERGAAAAVSTSGVETATGLVEKGTLVGIETKQGKLTRPPGPKVPVGPSGTLTSIPDVGTVVAPRGSLYRVDDRPVTYFTGTLPQWRGFEEGMPDGPDVGQLEQNLRDWGYLKGAANNHFDHRTRAGIVAWQKDTGQPETGAIESGRVLFGSGDLIVSDRKAVVGDHVGPGQEIYLTKRTEKIVTVDLPVGSSLAKAAGVVEVKPPSGPGLAGTIRSVGDPKTDDAGKTTVEVVIVVNDPAAIGDLDEVGVSVDFVSDERQDVLSVPVIALGARAGGDFVVDVLSKSGSTKSIPVEVGLFAGDRVEVTSDELTPGQKVVVPA